MSVSLSKGSKISLAKEAQNLGINLKVVNVGLGWGVNTHGGSDYDLDAWALGVTDKGLKKKNLVYYANTLDSSRCIHHLGDNLTGEGDGDDETITINLAGLPIEYKHVLIGVTLFRARPRKQTLADIDNAFIRLYDASTGIEICRFDSRKFKNDFINCVSVLFGVLSRVNGVWEFNAVGKGDKFGSITDALNVYGEYALDYNELQISNKNNGGNKKMAVSLSKGSKISLAKVAADAGIQGGLTKITVGLGWDINRYAGGATFDLDAEAFMLGASGKVRSDADFIFYSQKEGPGILHTGDNRTGEGDGDDEQIKLDLNAIPNDVEKIAFTVTIYEADTRNQSFGMIENSYIRVVDEASGAELIRYDLGEDFSVETAIVAAEIYRHNGEWKFNAVGSGFAGGLAALCGNFGVEV